MVPSTTPDVSSPYRALCEELCADQGQYVEQALELVVEASNLTPQQELGIREAVRHRMMASYRHWTADELEAEIGYLQAEVDSLGTFPSFVGMRGIAELFGVAEVTVRMWKKRGKLPPPDEIIDGTMHAWARGTVKAWAKEIQAYAAAVS